MANSILGNNLFNASSGNFSNIPPMPNGGQKPNKNQIITNLYRSVLGREPDSNALMYYISQPEINEDAIRKQMVESEEHKSILQEYKKIPDLKKQIEDLQSGDKSKEKSFQDKELEIQELNKILKHKTEEINRLKEELSSQQKNHVSSPVENANIPTTAKESFLHKLINKLLIK